MKDSLVIVIPAYNEEETIKAVLEEWYQIIERHDGDGASRLLVINDGSRDRTGEILSAFAKTHPLFVYADEKNGGHGAAIWNGYTKALRMKADYIFQTDSDGQTTPADFSAFWDRRKNADVVMGCRVNRGDGPGRALVSQVLRIVIRVVFRVKTADANCPYRLMKRDALQDAMRMVPARYHLTNVLLSVAFEKQKKKVHSLPICFRERQGGTNSIHLGKICKMGMRSLWEFSKLEREYSLMAGGKH